MLRLLLRQPVHIWQTLETRYKIEAILLFILVFAFVGTRLESVFLSWIEKTFSHYDLVVLVANAFVLQISLSMVFIISWLLPRQNSLRYFLTWPLAKSDCIKLLGFYGFKYASLYLLLFLPATAALFSVTGFWTSVGAIIIVMIFSLFFSILFFRQKQNSPSTTLFIVKALSSLLFYYALFAAAYYFENTFFIFQIVAALVAGGLIFKIYFSAASIELEKFIPYIEKTYSKPNITKTGLKKIPHFLPEIIQPLFEKEIVGFWRNPDYKKLKIKSLATFLILNSVIVLFHFEYKEIWISIITALLIWGHYNNSFNEKYVFADPTWFIKTLPMRFRHVFVAKYVAEIGYVFLLTLCTIIFFQFIDLNAGDQVLWLGGLFIFANVVLFTMLNFRIMFFNDPRLAGYAYNFAMFFIAIMVLNFHLVGPLIGLTLLVFFVYKNVKYFNE